jgi:PAS domain S-box-containing protein
MTRSGETASNNFWDYLNERVVVVEADSGVIHDVNTAVCERLGYSATDLTGRDVATICSVPEEAWSLDSVLQDGTDGPIPLDIRAHSGEWIHTRASCSHIEHAGTPLAVFLIREADTARNRPTGTHESTVVLRTMLENLTVGVLVEDANRDVLMANARLGETLGLSLDTEQLIGNDCAAAAEKIKDIFAEPERFIQSNNELLEQRTPVYGQEFELATGQTLLRDYVPYQLPGGDANLWIYRDITEQKQREQEQARHRDLLNQLQAVADIGGWEIDFRTDELHWTAKTYAIHGLSPDTAVATEDAFEFFHPDDRETVRTALEELRAHGEAYDLEVRLVPAADAVRWVRARGEPWIVDGERVGARGTFQDITERVQRECRIENQRDSLEVLNQVLRHDIRNDLQVVTGYADLLSETLDDEAGYVERICSAARHSVEITENAAAISKLLLQENDDEQFSAMPVHAIVEEELETLRETYSTAAIELTKPPTDSMVMANEMLRPVIRNLVGNAVQHNDTATPEVHITVIQNGANVQLRVADNGPGIPPERRDEIFGKGTKGLDSTGTGLGLYLVETIVEGFDGTVWVEDNEPIGSVFIVELPRWERI